MSIEISVIIYASGNVSEDGVSMFVNNIPINDSIESVNINDTSWQFIAYNFTIDSINYANEYNVKVTARANSIKLLRERQLPVGTVEMEGICV